MLDRALGSTPESQLHLNQRAKAAASQLGRISLIFLVACAVLWVIDALSLPFAPCVEPQVVRGRNDSKEHTNEKDACEEAHGLISSGLRQITVWSPESWTAAATIMLALCNLVLASATSKQVQLSREEYIAANRPLLRVSPSYS